MAVKSAEFSTSNLKLKPEFDSQHPHGTSQQSITVPEIKCPLLASVGTAHMRCTDIHAGKTPTHIKIIDKLSTKIHSSLRYASLERLIKTGLKQSSEICQITKRKRHMRQNDNTQL